MRMSASYIVNSPWDQLEKDHNGDLLQRLFMKGRDND